MRASIRVAAALVMTPAILCADEIASKAQQSGTDTSPPLISVHTPVSGAVYFTGRFVLASYTCSAPSGEVRCVGSVANGGALQTDVPGRHEFRVDSTDRAGNRSSLTSTYTVVNRRRTCLDLVQALHRQTTRVPQDRKSGP
jgi:hypothetical protein